MKNKGSVKNKKEDVKTYKKVDFDVEASLAGRELRKMRKKPTSVALDEETLLQLKQLAEEKGIPYQVLMRSYILQGIKKDKKSA